MPLAVCILIESQDDDFLSQSQPGSLSVFGSFLRKWEQPGVRTFESLPTVTISRIVSGFV